MQHALDHRDVAGLRGAWYKRLDERRMTAVVEVLCTVEDVGEDAHGYCTEEITVRFEWGVCPTCGGRGSHTNPSIDAQGLSAEDFLADPDFAMDYLSGKYDVACNECGGQRVVPVPADDDPNRDRVFERQAEIALAAREQAHEMRMGY